MLEKGMRKWMSIIKQKRYKTAKYPTRQNVVTKLAFAIKALYEKNRKKIL